MSKKQTWGVHVGFLSVLCLVVVGLMAGNVFAAPGMPSSGEHKNVRLVGYNDLQGRESLQVTTKSDENNGDWVYVGHHDNYWDGTQRYNPITKAMEWNGTSILDISNPAKPKYVWHIPNTESANSRSAQVVYDIDGTDYLIRNSEGTTVTYQIFDITDRDNPSLAMNAPVAAITGTPEDSCGTGCGGPFLSIHKGWWSQTTKLYYCTANEPGFRSRHLIVFNLSEPENPKFVGRGWLYGQKIGENDDPPYPDQLHHPVVDEAHGKVFGGYRSTSGLATAWDISAILADPDDDPAKNADPLWVQVTKPPYREQHTVAPVYYTDLPNFGEGASSRTFALSAEEATGGDMLGCEKPLRTKLYMIDITEESNTFPVSTWQVPDGDFCEKGGRFGPHQFNETINGELNTFTDKIIWVAYFNAGARVVDISDPFHMKEVGYYIPNPTANSHPVSDDPIQPITIQINDTDVDHRGLAYAVDRAGAGLFVLEYTGNKK